MALLFLIIANFIFYITFVQFGLLKIIEGRFGLAPEALGLSLGLMALTGAVSSSVAGFLMDRRMTPLSSAFRLACILSVLEGIAAIGAIILFDQGLLPHLFALLGLLMGVNGVLLIRSVESWPVEKRGMLAGCAMGVVYLAANMIGGFIAMPERIALINGIMAVIIGVLCLPYSYNIRPFGTARTIRTGYVKMLLILSILVSVDSFVFFMETNRPEIYRYTWDGRWMWNGIVHAVTAVVAGILWDRGKETAVIGTSISAFAGALFLMSFLPIGFTTGLISTFLYNTAVSFYGILLLLVWYYTPSNIGPGGRIGTGMAVAAWLAAPAGIAAAIKTADVSSSLLFGLSMGLVLFLLPAAFMGETGVDKP